MTPAISPAPALSAAPVWSDAQRGLDFNAWLRTLVDTHELQIETLRMASADASFRRYFRIDAACNSFIIMDAPPDKEDCQPFVKVARLMQQAGLLVPQLLAWEQTQGFLLLSDLGAQTMLQVIALDSAMAN
jgi:N-acetylmuramate 1-kinase